jgi:hypothetical protein
MNFDQETKPENKRTHSEDLFSILWDCKIYLFNFLIVLFVVWFSAQGKDLLVGITEKEGFEGHLLAILFLFGLVFLGMMNWHTPRYHYMDNVESNRKEIESVNKWYKKLRYFLFPKADDKHREDYKDKVQDQNSILIPRWIGMITIQTAGFALFKIYFENKISEGSFLANYMFYIFLICAILSYFLLRFFERFFGNASVYSKHRGETIIYWGIIFVLLLMFTKGLVIRSLTFGLGIILVSVLFGLIVTIRNRKNKLFKFIRDWMITKALIKRAPKLAHIITFITLVLGIVFLIINFFSIGLNGFYPLLILLLALIFYTSLLSNFVYLLRYYKNKYNKYLLLVIVLLVIILSERSSDLHNVRLVHSSTSANERDSLPEYFEAWVNKNKVLIENYLADSTTQHDKFPIFLCANEGGGSRAAYWTNLVLTNLHNSTDGKFLNHCFAMSSASGGTFGSASFVSFLDDTSSYNHRRDTINYIERVNTIHSRNYLSRSLANLLGKDLFKYFLFNLSFKPDRAALQEIEWSKGVEMGIKKVQSVKVDDTNDYVFERPYLSFWYDEDSLKYRKPLLFANTTEVSKGIRGIVSPVKMQFSKGIDMLAGIEEANKGQGLSLRMSTSALLSARFPFVNPGGKIKSLGTFVDGGYYDNIGGTTIMEVLNTCNDVIENHEDSLFKKLEFHLIMITNSEQKKDSIPKKFNQILIPPSTIVATQSGHTQYLKEKLLEKFNKNNFHHVSLRHDKTEILIGDPRFNDGPLKFFYGTKKYKPIIPLARYLSESSVKGIQANIDLNCNELNQVVQLIGGDGAFCDE